MNNDAQVFDEERFVFARTPKLRLGTPMVPHKKIFQPDSSIQTKAHLTNCGDALLFESNPYSEYWYVAAGFQHYLLCSNGYYVFQLTYF